MRAPRRGDAAVAIDVCSWVPAAACRDLARDCGVGGGEDTVVVETTLRWRVAPPLADDSRKLTLGATVSGQDWCSHVRRTRISTILITCDTHICDV
jgi:hypothetical protein